MTESGRNWNTGRSRCALDIISEYEHLPTAKRNPGPMNHTLVNLHPSSSLSSYSLLLRLIINATFEPATRRLQKMLLSFSSSHLVLPSEAELHPLCSFFFVFFFFSYLSGLLPSTRVASLSVRADVCLVGVVAVGEEASGGRDPVTPYYFN